MFHMVRNEIRRALLSPPFYLGLILCFLLYAFSMNLIEWKNMFAFPSGTVVDKHNMFFIEFNPFRSLLPLAAALPMCASFAEDWEHRTTYFIVSRCTFPRYCLCKFISSGLLGGVVLATGLLGYLILLHVFLPFYNDSTYYEPFIEPLLLNNQWNTYLLYWGTLQFLLGILCAGLGCAVSTLTARRSMIFLGPMLTLSMLEIATNITIVGLSGGQSSIVFRDSNQTPLHIYLLIAAILVGLSLLTFTIYYYLMKRRVYQWQ